MLLHYAIYNAVMPFFCEGDAQSVTAQVKIVILSFLPWWKMQLKTSLTLFMLS